MTLLSTSCSLEYKDGSNDWLDDVIISSKEQRKTTKLSEFTEKLSEGQNKNQCWKSQLQVDVRSVVRRDIQTAALCDSQTAALIPGKLHITAII